MRARRVDSRLLAASAAGLWTANALPSVTTILPALAGAFGARTSLRRPCATLTFDDGPHPRGTPAVLEALAAAEVRATFFLVGEQVARRPGLAAEIVAAGHEVGVHCHRHRTLLRLGPRAVATDLDRALWAIEAACAVRPTLWRPPRGILSAAGLLAARRRGLSALLWSRAGRDWRATATPESIRADAVGAGVHPGEVILLHDADFYAAPGSWRRTVAALPSILEAIGEAGSGSAPARDPLTGRPTPGRSAASDRRRTGILRARMSPASANR
jgi:peptidoglycan/xylan/chitin deacetylase (PgdA/CDA1 family)